MVQVYFQVRQFQLERFKKKNGKFEKIPINNDEYSSCEIDNRYLISRKQIKIPYQLVVALVHDQNIEYYDEQTIEITDWEDKNPQKLEKNNDEKSSYCLKQDEQHEEFIFHIKIQKPIAKIKYERFIKYQEVENQLALKQQKQKDQKEEEKQSSFLFVTAKPEDEKTHLQTDREIKKILFSINKNPDIMILKQFQKIKRNLQNNKIEIIHFGTHIKTDDKKKDFIHLEKEDNQLDIIELQQLGLLFQEEFHKPKIVFLNCCNSGVFQNYIKKSQNQINWIVIDKDFKINDKIAIKFANHFYKALFSNQKINKINLKEVFEEVQLDLCFKFIKSPQAFHVGDLFKEKSDKCKCMEQAIQYILEKECKLLEKFLEKENKQIQNFKEKMEVLLTYASQFIFLHNKKNDRCDANNSELEISTEEQAQKKISTLKIEPFIFQYYEYYVKQTRAKNKVKIKESKLLYEINQKPVGREDKDTEKELLTQKAYDQIYKILQVYLQKYCPFYRYRLIQPQKQQELSIDFNNGYPHIKSGFVNLNMDSDFIKNNSTVFAELKSQILKEIQINDYPIDQSDQMSDKTYNKQFVILDLNHTYKAKQYISMCLANCYENQFQNEFVVEFFPTQKISSNVQNSDGQVKSYVNSKIINKKVSKKLKDKKKIFHVFVFKQYPNLKQISKKKDNTNLKQLIEKLKFPKDFFAVIAIVDIIQYNITIKAGLKYQIEEQLKNQKFCILNIDHTYKVKKTVFMCLRDIYQNESEIEYCAEYHTTKQIQSNYQVNYDAIEQHIKRIQQEAKEAKNQQKDNKITFHIYKNYSNQEANQEEDNTNLKQLTENPEFNVNYRIIIINIYNKKPKEKVDLNEIQEIFYNKKDPSSYIDINRNLLNFLNETNKKQFEEYMINKLNNSSEKQLTEINLNSKKVSKEIVKFLARKNLIHLKIPLRQQFSQESQLQQQIMGYFLNENQLNFQLLCQDDILIYNQIIKNKAYFQSNSQTMEKIILLFLSNLLFQPFKMCKTLKYDKIIECIQNYQSKHLLKDIKYLNEMLQYINLCRMLKASEANPNIFNYSFINYIQLSKTQEEKSEENQDMLKIVLIQLIKSVEESVAFNYTRSKDEYMKIESNKFLKKALFNGIENIINQISSQEMFKYNVLFLNASLVRIMLRFKIIFGIDDYKTMLNQNEKFTKQINQIIEFSRDYKITQQDQNAYQAIIENIKNMRYFIEINYEDFMQVLEVKEKKNLSIHAMVEIAGPLTQDFLSQDQENKNQMMISQDQLLKFIEKYCLVKYYFIFENKMAFKNTFNTAKNIDSLIEKLKIRCLFQFSIIKDSFLSFDLYTQVPKILIIDAYYSKDKFMIQDKKQLSFELIEQNPFCYQDEQNEGIQYIKLVFLFTNQKEYLEIFKNLKCNIVYLDKLNKIPDKQIGQFKKIFEEFIQIFFTKLLDKQNQNIFSNIFFKSCSDLENNNNLKINYPEELKLFIKNIQFENYSQNQEIDIHLQECCEYKSQYPYFKSQEADNLYQLLLNVKEDNLQTTWLEKLDNIPPYLKEYISNIYENNSTQISEDNYTDSYNFNNQSQQYSTVQNNQPQSLEENIASLQNEFRHALSQDNNTPANCTNVGQQLTQMKQLISKKMNQTNVGIKSKISKNNEQISKNNQKIFKSKSDKKIFSTKNNKENQIYKQEYDQNPQQNGLNSSKQAFGNQQSYEQIKKNNFELNNQQQENLVGQVYLVGDLDPDTDE